MANACRDNFERAQFVGYDPRRVRLLQFALSGFFAGIGGGLYVLIYEIVTFDTVSAAKSGWDGTISSSAITVHFGTKPAEISMI